ncbi:MAG TPA: aminotransferase class V-fold PLP-dependent enzyme [Candidatus Tyrphobacter sp.]
MTRGTNRSFASDNNAPVAPEIFDALHAANEGDAVGYGHDPWTQRAVRAFREHFGAATDVYFTFNGTGANVVALSCLVKPWEAVLCPASAHLQTDECGAFERFSGSKVIPIATDDGKLRPQDLDPHLHAGHDEHHPQPRVVSISHSTEYGGVYEPDELRELCDYAHSRGLLVHVDGARIANAAAAVGQTPRGITIDLGVDVLTFGGTKNGLMFGEAICFFDPTLPAGAAPFARKQGMQLASKMRYVAAQFEALLANDLWLRYAAHANAMTARLHERVRSIAGIRVTRPVRCNAIFATMERAALTRAQDEFFFYIFDDALPEARWMTHWATQPHEVDAFADALERALG